MRKTNLLITSLLMLVALFSACSTDVDLYADYKDITVVYGLLDSGKDTNYVKINKAFLGPGNALEIALIDDSCNYPYKLDAKILEKRAPANGTKYELTRTLVLDTLTIHTKEPGVFYSPDQLVYYTAEPINSNTDRYKYRYELQIDRGDTLLTAETDIVGGETFIIESRPLGFSADKGKIYWYPCPNAVVYEVVVKFYFTEIGPGTETRDRCMTWSLGTHPASTLTEDHGRFIVTYKSAMFYSHLANFLGDDTLGGSNERTVERVITDYCLGIGVSAGGEELYNFITVNGPSSSIVQNLPEYTNISGDGYGVFSSRAAKEQIVKMSSIPHLIAHRNWKFRQGK